MLIFNSLNSYVLANKSFQVASIFSDNMVLQRGINAPIWGNGIAGDIITVEIGAKKNTSKVLDDGKWLARLPKLPVGGPYTLKVFNQHDSILFINVLVGDVWLASGQSNMQMALSWGVYNKDEEIEKANFPNIRFFSVANDLNNKPQSDISGGSWTVSTPQSVKDFSAIGYFFARQISNELNVPIGIINSSWGGTDIQAWMSRESLETVPLYRDTLPKIITQTADFSNGYEQFEQTNKRRDSIIENSNLGFETKVFAPNYDDENWKSMDIPCRWSDVGIRNFYGYVWLRKNIVLTENAKELVLYLGDVAHENIAFFNGVELKKLDNDANVRYNIPSNLLKIGKNTIALRVLGRWGVGGFNSPATYIHLTSNDKSINIPLAGNWKYNERIEPETPEWFEYYNYPTFIYNAKIAPIIPFGLKGFLWYQGENNTKKPEGYSSLMSLLVKDWRTRWEQGNLPFIFGQLSNFGMRVDKPCESKFAVLREEQMKSLSIKNSAMVVNIDLGLADGEVHFKNKQESAKRFANAALGLVYDTKTDYKNPIYKSFEVEGNEIRIRFKNVDNGLKTNDKLAPKSFAIAGRDRIFISAQARIIGNEIIVWSDKIKNPTCVRYAWDDNPECNLYGVDGLPVAPFRTDK